MPRDLTDTLCREIIKHLKADIQVATIYGERIYDRVPAQAQKPYIRYGAPIAAPFEAMCLDGSENRVTLHSFIEGPDSSAANAGKEAIQAAMEKFNGSAAFSVIDRQWINTQRIRAGIDEAIFHHVIEYEITAAVRTG